MEPIELERAPEPVHFDPTPMEISEMNAPVHSSWWSRLEDKWNRIQVGRQGSYSVERLLSLEAYCKTSSRTRVFLVCLLTPLPALLTAVLVECMPLRPPSEGMAANWVFWLRLVLVEFIIVLVMTVQMSRFIPSLQLSRCKVFAIVCGVSFPFVGVCLVAGNTIGFPVPFMLQFGLVPIGILTSIMYRLVLDPSLFVKGSPLQLQFERYQRVFISFMTVCGTYPIYIVLYSMIPEKYQGFTAIIVPIWKFASRHVLVRAARELEDTIPAVAALTVDFACALFISASLVTAGSMSLSFLLIGADFVQALLEMREVGSNARGLLRTLSDRQKFQTARPYAVLSKELLPIILDNMQHSASFGVDSLKGVRLWASLPHHLTTEHAARLQILEASGAICQHQKFPTQDTTRKLNTRTCLKARVLQRGLVAPKPLLNIPNSVHETRPGTHESNAKSHDGNIPKEIVLQGLQLLFHCEYLVLVEYVECVVPLVFVIYKSILEHLSNVVYFPGGPGNWSVEILGRVALFVALECGSLLLFNSLFQRKLAFSPFYQLAFVLETDVCVVQPILFCAILKVLQYDLQHFGADFSLRFEWLKDSGQQ